MKITTFVSLCLACMLDVSVCLFTDDGCRYEYRMAADKCITANRALDEKLSHLESMQEQNVERVNSVTIAYNQEFNVLAQDSKVLKTVTNRLVEDSVKIEGKLRVLQDVGSDVRDLRNKVSTDKKQLVNMIGQVTGQLERQAAEQSQAAEKMKTQMSDNKEILSGLQSKVTLLEDRLSKLGPGESGSTNTDSSQVDKLRGELAELKTKLDSNIRFYQGQFQALITTVQQMQQQLRSRK